MEIVYGMYRVFVHVIKLLRWPAGTVALMHLRLSTLVTALAFRVGSKDHSETAIVQVTRMRQLISSVFPAQLMV